jgi:hypothetical protein
MLKIWAGVDQTGTCSIAAALGRAPKAQQQAAHAPRHLLREIFQVYNSEPLPADGRRKARHCARLDRFQTGDLISLSAARTVAWPSRSLGGAWLLRGNAQWGRRSLSLRP